MSQAAVAPRRPAVWIPRQHGAWAMISVPFIVGATMSGWTWLHLPLLAFWLVGYLDFAAAGLWLKSRRKPRYRPPVLVYSIACGVLGLAVLALAPKLALWAPLFVPLMAVSLWCSLRRRERSLVNDIVTVVAACLMTVVANDAGTRPDVGHALVAAAVLLAYFAGTVFYVKTLIRERGSTGWLAASLIFHALAGIAVGAWCWQLGIVFAVLFARAAIAPRFTLTPAMIGAGEIVMSLVVMTVLLICPGW